MHAVAAQKGKQAAASETSGGYTGTTVIVAGVLSAVVVFLAAGVVALVVRQLHRRQQGKALPGRAMTVDISHVSACGFETVRAECTSGPATTVVEDTTTQPNESTA